MGGGGLVESLVSPMTGLTRAAGSLVRGVMGGEVPGSPGALPAAPDEGDAEVQAAKKKERKLARLRSGRQSTILSNLRQQLSPSGQGGGAQLG